MVSTTKATSTGLRRLALLSTVWLMLSVEVGSSSISATGTETGGIEMRRGGGTEDGRACGTSGGSSGGEWLGADATLVTESRLPSVMLTAFSTSSSRSWSARKTCVWSSSSGGRTASGFSAARGGDGLTAGERLATRVM